MDSSLLHAGLEALADGICLVDREWRIAYCNRTAARLLALPVAGAADAGAAEATVPGTVAARLAAAMSTRKADEVLFEDLPGDPGGCWRIHASPLAGGGLTIHLRDANEETRLSRHYSRLLESIGDGFVALDAEGKVVYLNTVAERLLRLPRGRTIGKLAWPLLPDTDEALEATIRATLADGRPRQLRRVRPEGVGGGDRRFDLRIHPLHDGGATILFRDVTRAVERERDLARYAAEAEDANRAKSRFFAAVSHELRTPLNALVGYTHLLTTGTYGPLPAAAIRAASRAGVCAEHLARLVDDLLLMTTTEIDRLPLATTPIVLAEFLPLAAEPNRQQAEAKGLAFTVDVAREIPDLISDPDRLRQLLNALLSNAVKFTSRGEVRLEARALTNGSGDSVRFRVVDTGPGIPEEARQRIFDAFEQLGNSARSDSLSRGSGLGLTVARHLAALLDGTLALERSDAGGSVFVLDLPLAQDE